MNRKTSVYTVSFSPRTALDQVIGGLPHTLAGSGFSGEETAFIRIRCRDDFHATRLADTCTEGKVTSLEVTTGVGIHRRVVDLDSIRRTLAAEH